MRCELLLQFRNGEQILSFLDVLPEDYEALPSVLTRAEYERMAQQMAGARSVREYEESPKSL